MSLLRRGAWLLPLALAVLLATTGCGDDDSTNSSPSPSGAPSGEASIEDADTLLTVTYPAGDVQLGAPASVASGDFNGDGETDLLIGAPMADGPDDLRPDAGEAYVLLGPLSGDVDLASDTPAVRVLGALSGDNLGAGVAAGDLNGDGTDDIVLGAPNSNGLTNIRTDMGEAYVIFGRSDLPATVDTANREQDFDLVPAEGFSHLGLAFAIGDVDGDGTDDLVAGAPYAGRADGTPVGGERTTVGEVYVLYGGSDFGGDATVAEQDQDVTISGLAQYDQFGQSVAVADVDGDGTLEIIVGASGYDGPDGDRDEAGGAFVFHQDPDLPTRLTRDDAGTIITGADENDTFGTLVAAADVNGDGRAEVIASAPGGAGPANDRHAAGEVAVIDLAGDPAQVDVGSDAAAHRIFAPTAGELAPAAMAVSGTAQLIALGSSMRDGGGQAKSGAVYVAGALLEADADLATATMLQLNGGAANDGAGSALAFADVDGDGVGELLAQAAGVPSMMGVDPNYRARLYIIRLG